MNPLTIPQGHVCASPRLHPCTNAYRRKLYGGTERIVSYITEEFVRRGHDVTLFAAGDAETNARLHPACPQALRLAGKQEFGAFLQLPMLSDVYENADDFDVIHTHIDYWSFAFARLSKTPTISTMPARSRGTQASLFALQERASGLNQRLSAEAAPLHELGRDGSSWSAARPSDLQQGSGKISRLPRTHLA
jgi:glycosyltransferase involved in cell wall biosynthesis